MLSALTSFLTGRDTEEEETTGQEVPLPEDEAAAEEVEEVFHSPVNAPENGRRSARKRKQVEFNHRWGRTH